MGRARDMVERAGRAWSRRAAGAAGFTLIETMVAVGAMAFIAVGIAVIFETTGKTVTAGRSVSAYNSYAAALQERLRADIAAMTREGFLVIRHGYADVDANGKVDPTPTDPQPWPYLTHQDRVQLAPGDEHPRLRRTDELMFFAKGQFVSAREALVAGVNARAEAARIYYGHGQRRRVDATDPNTGNNPYLRPEPYDTNVETAMTPASDFYLGAKPANPNVVNPNRYASDWMLLRHVTLLAPAQTAERPVPTTPPTWMQANDLRVQDNDIQVALQPAASNLFRVLAVTFPDPPSGSLVRSASNGTPRFASGLVDIATTSLREVRAIVTTACDPTAVTADFFFPAFNTGPEGPASQLNGQYLPDPTGTGALAVEHNWMNEALPTPSHDIALTDYCRLRYEPAPPDFLGVLKDETGTNTPDRDFRRADQVMLSASNFLPRCTEFIVEWSFGKRYPVTHPQANELIWHGLDRSVRRGGTSGTPVIMAEPYDDRPASPGQHAVGATVPLRNGTSISHKFTTELIHGFDSAALASPWTVPLTSFFGYVDPTFNPDMDGPAGSTGGAPDGKLESDKDAAAATVAWPWPKLIRVTLSLADPGDPMVERTFQFVFEVPQEGAR